MNKTKFVYDENRRPIGRVDQYGNLYTLKGRRSYPHYDTKLGLAVNRSHAEREAAALDVSFDE